MPHAFAMRVPVFRLDTQVTPPYNHLPLVTGLNAASRNEKMVLSERLPAKNEETLRLQQALRDNKRNSFA
ncbi:MAG: hypothetical protein HQK58_08675 [Deltaproteobacteria bacterium]|nr:hypothetical protein [Deltaproteobacteria bacterium]